MTTMMLQRHIELMHAELDGANTPTESSELKRILAADPDAQAEFAALQALNRTLSSLPEHTPSANLKKRIMNSDAVRSATAPRRARSLWSFVTIPSSSHQPYEASMKQQHKLIFGGIIAVVVVVVYSSLIYPWPVTPDAIGTIGGVKKYHQDQITDKDVQVGTQDGQAGNGGEIGRQAELFRSAPVDRQAELFRSAPIDLQASLMKNAPAELAAKTWRAAPVEKAVEFFRSAPLDKQAELFRSAPLDKAAELFRSAPLDRQQQLERAVSLDSRTRE